MSFGKLCTVYAASESTQFTITKHR